MDRELSKRETAADRIEDGSAIRPTILQRAGRPSVSDEVRRTRLLDAAARIFLKNGYVTTTMAAVADAAGMSKKTLYQVFPSKLALFDALLKAQFYQLPILADLGGDTQEERLARLLLAIATMLTHPDRVALVRLIIIDGQVSPELSTAFERLEIGRDLNEVEAWISQEMIAGKLWVEDVSEAATLLYGMAVAEPMLAWLLRAPRHDTMELLEGRIRRAVAVFLRGMKVLSDERSADSAARSAGMGAELTKLV
ncbi:MAG: TetR/AcrR family transcriptional regulator [Janthinobacterium lividum]